MMMNRSPSFFVRTAVSVRRAMLAQQRCLSSLSSRTINSNNTFERRSRVGLTTAKRRVHLPPDVPPPIIDPSLLKDSRPTTVMEHLDYEDVMDTSDVLDQEEELRNANGSSGEYERTYTTTITKTMSASPSSSSSSSSSGDNNFISYDEDYDEYNLHTPPSTPTHSNYETNLDQVEELLHHDDVYDVRDTRRVWDSMHSSGSGGGKDNEHQEGEEEGENIIPPEAWFQEPEYDEIEEDWETMHCKVEQSKKRNAQRAEDHDVTVDW